MANGGKPYPREHQPPQLSEGAQSIAANGNHRFHRLRTQNGLGRCDLYITEMKNGKWQEARNPGQPINTRGWESQPSLSADGQYALLRQRPAGIPGLIDIWSSKEMPPANGEHLKTSVCDQYPEREQAPFIPPRRQDALLHVGRPPRPGGFDLYLSRLQPDGSWGKPPNLGYPINTDANEGALIVSLDGQTAYFSTDRSGWWTA